MISLYDLFNQLDGVDAEMNWFLENSGMSVESYLAKNLFELIPQCWCNILEVGRMFLWNFNIRLEHKSFFCKMKFRICYMLVVFFWETVTFAVLWICFYSWIKKKHLKFVSEITQNQIQKNPLIVNRENRISILLHSMCMCGWLFLYCLKHDVFLKTTER